MNEVLYYKSAAGICAYDGSPAGVRLPGPGAAGGRKRPWPGVWRTGITLPWRERGCTCWTRPGACGTGRIADRPWPLPGGERTVPAVGNRTAPGPPGSVGQSQGPVAWQAQTGPLDFGPDGLQIHPPRLALGLWLAKGSSLEVYLEYDSDGVWRHAGHLSGTGRRGGGAAEHPAPAVQPPAAAAGRGGGLRGVQPDQSAGRGERCAMTMLPPPARFQGTAQQQLAQCYSYLFQLHQQLNNALAALPAALPAGSGRAFSQAGSAGGRD